MATAGEQTASPSFMAFFHTPAARMLTLMIGVAAIVGIMVGVWMWSQQPDYRVLFANFTEKDGGAIVATLEQMNVPYKVAEGGNAILAPSDQVYEIRLKLASQGLPKGSGVGFELLESQKLGVSQFLEQVNFHRALEGEMARSIQSIGAVQSARVHFALQKPSVFVREKQNPTASVLLNLHPGRMLSPSQVNAIIHLVASSIPNLHASDITVVDQSGTLLSGADKQDSAMGLDPRQLHYVQELERSIVKRVESIISPLVGVNNVRAEANADVDFSRSEQAAEIYKPNQQPNFTPTIRSKQSSESQMRTGNVAGGIPGALSNQPPQPATAPITATPGTGAQIATTPFNTQKQATINYEVDKTIRYTQQPMGGIKRLSVAVVVNYKKKKVKGKITLVPLSDAEKIQITELVKEAMGFSETRGDSLNVLNASFAVPEKEPEVKVPFWKRPAIWDLGKQIGKYTLGGAVILYLFFAYFRPMMRKLSSIRFTPPVTPRSEEDAVVQLSQQAKKPIERSYEDNLSAAKNMARQDPKVVANVVKTWVGGNE